MLIAQTAIWVIEQLVAANAYIDLVWAASRVLHSTRKKLDEQASGQSQVFSNQTGNMTSDL